MSAYDVPPLTTKWDSDERKYPKVTPSMFAEYAAKKTEGGLGQQQKAFFTIEK